MDYLRFCELREKIEGRLSLKPMEMDYFIRAGEVFGGGVCLANCTIGWFMACEIRK